MIMSLSTQKSLLLGWPLFSLIMGLVLCSCASGQESDSVTIASTSTTITTETSTLTPTFIPTSTPEPTSTPTATPTFTLTPTSTPRPTHTPSPTPTLISGPVVPDGWNLYEQVDGIYAIAYPAHWEESPFPFSYNADLTLFPSNEPLLVKVEIALVYDPSGITVEGVATAVEDGLSQDPNIELYPLESIEVSEHTGLVRSVDLSLPGEGEPGLLPGRHYYFVNNGFSFIITVLADQSVFEQYTDDFDAIISTLYFPPAAP